VAFAGAATGAGSCQAMPCVSSKLAKRAFSARSRASSSSPSGVISAIAPQPRKYRVDLTESSPQPGIRSK
jgi:hypothetical protein